MEDLLARHRKEQKDLQSRVTQKKKSATKKTRRGINDECEKLQRELSEKHQAEIAELNGDGTGETNGLPADGLEDLNLDGEGKTNGLNGEKKTQNEDEDADADTNTTDSTPGPPHKQQEQTPTPRGKKPNRQKARLARRAAEQAAATEQAHLEASQQTNHRGNEKEAMDAAFKKLNLTEIDINPDGHCLFSAVATQLDTLGLGLRPDPARITLPSTTQARIDTVASPKHDGYRAVRAVTADFLTEHSGDFEAFMEEPLDSYARKIRLTAEWGGQLELLAIARAYGVNINVVQGDGRIEKIEAGDADGEIDEEEKARRVIWLAYYRHTYGLGEHYNALTAKA
ncbi:hypothetical protein BDV18DRAFT_134880 [Aspergillus unguis]